MAATKAVSRKIQASPVQVTVKRPSLDRLPASSQPAIKTSAENKKKCQKTRGAQVPGNAWGEINSRFTHIHRSMSTLG
jgi:hypothetical protein